MSFLLIRGEMFHCTNCRRMFTVDFEGGPQATQIGDFNVYEQIELNREFMPEIFKCESEGYYFHEPVLCETCLSILDHKTILYEVDKYPPFDVLMSYSQKYSKIIKADRQDYIDSFISKVDKSYCQQLSPTVFEETIGHKFFKITSHKNELAQRYIEGTKTEILKNYFDHITGSDKYKETASEYKNLISTCEQECRDLLEKGITGYCQELDLNGTVNLNPHICYETTIRKRIPPKDHFSLFDGPYEIDTEGLKAFLSEGINQRLIDIDEFEQEALLQLIQKKVSSLF